MGTKASKASKSPDGPTPPKASEAPPGTSQRASSRGRLGEGSPAPLLRTTSRPGTADPATSFTTARSLSPRSDLTGSVRTARARPGARKGPRLSTRQKDLNLKLWHAAAEGDYAEVGSLLGKGAHSLWQNPRSNGDTALHVAALCCQQKALHVLLQHGKGEEDEVDKAMWGDGGSKSAEVANVRNFLGRTPLHSTAFFPVPSAGNELDTVVQRVLICIQHLLSSGADPVARDNDMWTPLHYMAFFGHEEGVNLLLTNRTVLEDLQTEAQRAAREHDVSIHEASHPLFIVDASSFRNELDAFKAKKAASAADAGKPPTGSATSLLSQPSWRRSRKKNWLYGPVLTPAQVALTRKVAITSNPKSQADTSMGGLGVVKRLEKVEVSISTQTSRQGTRYRSFTDLMPVTDREDEARPVSRVSMP